MEQKKIDELASLFAKEMKTGQDLNAYHAGENCS
jgi:hypothetical protein